MFRKGKKFIIVVLLLLLILSNFSFAITYSICTMGIMTGTMKETCARNNHDLIKINGFAISKTKKTCCEERVSELSNSNILSANGTTQYSCIVNCVHHFVNTISIPDNISQPGAYLIYPDKIPKDGIPITISSLII